MFSNSTKYAIRTVEFLFLYRNIGKTSVAELAMELNIPRSYLSKVLQQLSKSKIISSTKGRGGGFYMSKENIKRPLIDIIICIEGYNVSWGYTVVKMKLLAFYINILGILRRVLKDL